MDTLSRRALLGAGLARLVPERLAPPDTPETDPRPTGSDWAGGDEDALFRWLEPAADELVEAAGVNPGDDVLDVAAGDGNVALAAARRGARVVACDLRPAAVQRGRARTDAAGVPVEWIEAVAEKLPFPDQSFDHVLSGFGAIYAPRPHEVAAELRRVARTAGTVAVSSWASAEFMGRVLDCAAERDAAGGGRPSTWGRYETLYLLFDGATRPLDVLERVLPLDVHGPEEAWDFLASTPGPVGAAARRLPQAEREALRREVLEAAAGLTRGDQGFEIPYVVAVAACNDW